MCSASMPRLNLNHVDITQLSEYLSQDLDESNISSEKSLFSPEEFNEYVKLMKLNEQKNIFSCMHMSCRSIGRNIDSVISLINVLNVQFCAIGISETWLKPNDSLCNIQIDGYKFIGNGRDKRRGGSGVGICICNDLNFVHRLDLDVNPNFLESIYLLKSRVIAKIQYLVQ